MSESRANNKRIAKNTLALYFRQILIMLVSLYTSRVILQALGVEDFGIYNVVGGVVTMFSFITGTLGSASQRFLAYDMAKGDETKLRHTFSLILMSYFILAIVTILLSESCAVWFLNSKMTIPEERLYAANWVLQLSIVTFCIHIFQAPFMSVIIAHEKMDVYAYASIVEVIMKLIIVYLLHLFVFDKLIVYSILMCLNALGIFLFYYIYCYIKFKESRYKYYFNSIELKGLCSYAWWNVIGSIAIILRSQGINILLNIFFNPIVNAARGIAYQVNSAITSFYTNFYTAVRPQIVKNYAIGENSRMLSLICNSSRYAFYLVLVMIMPFMFYAQEILDIWLKTPPVMTDLFVKLVLISALIETLSIPLVSGLQAANRIKEIQLTVSMLYLLNIPISYLLLSYGYPAETPMYVNIVLIIMAFIPRIWIAHKIIGLSIRYYAKSVLAQIFIVTIFAFFICYLFSYVCPSCSLLSLIANSILMMVFTIIVIACIGVNSAERELVYNVLKRKINYDNQKN